MSDLTLIPTELWHGRRMSDSHYLFAWAEGWLAGTGQNPKQQLSERMPKLDAYRRFAGFYHRFHQNEALPHPAELALVCRRLGKPAMLPLEFPAGKELLADDLMDEALQEISDLGRRTLIDEYMDGTR